jgi:predicted DsbA family dithiol-disulfide isomerase
MEAAQVTRIDIVSDVICPWCFIGKRRLEKALALRPTLKAQLAWRPFQLNPDMPIGGMERHAYIAAKFGGTGQADRIYENVAAVGRTVDIAFAFDRIRRTPNTQDAHRLIRYATASGSADVVVERLFGAYFIEGRDIGDRRTLVALAEETGHDAAAVRQWLYCDTGLEDVLAEDRGARRLGINAVPCFIFDGQYAVSGAQEPELFLPVLDLVQNGDRGDPHAAQ